MPEIKLPECKFIPTSEDLLDSLISEWNNFEFKAIEVDRDGKPDPNQLIFKKMEYVKNQILELIKVYPHLKYPMLKNYNFMPPIEINL